MGRARWPGSGAEAAARLDKAVVERAPQCMVGSKVGCLVVGGSPYYFVWVGSAATGPTLKKDRRGLQVRNVWRLSREAAAGKTAKMPRNGPAGAAGAAADPRLPPGGVPPGVRRQRAGGPVWAVPYGGKTLNPKTLNPKTLKP